MCSEAWPAHIGIGTSPLLLQTAPRAGRGIKGVAAFGRKGHSLPSGNSTIREYHEYCEGVARGRASL
jgi:hypothetical protein